MTSYFKEYDRELLFLERIEQNTKQVTDDMNIKTVLNLIELGQNNDFIQFVTKLPIEEIAKIREENL